MNTYCKDKQNFLSDSNEVLQVYEYNIDNEPVKKSEVTTNPAPIEQMEVFLSDLGIGVSDAEKTSWISSFMYLRDVVCDLSSNVDIALECIEEWKRATSIKDLPCRIDVMISGCNSFNQKIIVLLEMKQWSNDPKHGDYFNDKYDNGDNPSVQALKYCEYLKKNNTSVSKGNITIIPIVCCYNLDKGTIGNRINGLESQKFAGKTIQIFYKDDKIKLKHTLEDILNKDCLRERVFLDLRKGMPGTTGVFADKVEAIFSNTDPKMPASTLRVDQLQVYNDAKKVINEMYQGNMPREKQLRVEGGSGSGKSILALEILTYILNRNEKEENKLSVRLFTPQNAPIDSYKSIINNSGAITAARKTTLENTICQIGSKPSSPDQKIHFQVLIGDEIQLCYSDVDDYYDYDLFIAFRDEKQGGKNNFYMSNWSCDYYLVSQFRCNFEEGYVSFIDRVLRNTSTPLSDARNLDFDVRIIRNKECFNYISDKKHRKEYMFLAYDESKGLKAKGFTRFKRYTEAGDSFLFANKNAPGTLYAPYTFIRGLEGERIVVYIGKDELYMEDGKITTSFPHLDMHTAFFVLLTRGMQSCYIYCEDEKLRDYLHDEKKIPWYYGDSYKHPLMK